MSFKQPKIIMYHATISPHSLGPVEREAGADIYDLPVEKFRAQLEYLRDNGYKVVTLRNKAIFDEKDVILTFDDGEHNNYEYAFPILKEFGIKAYFFVAAKNIGKPGYMSLNELSALRDCGMLIGSRGLSNEIMTELLDTQIEEELRASKVFLETNLQTEILDFSAPRGYVNDKIIRMARQLGYENVFVSKRPKSVSEPCLGRIGVRAGWKLKRFVRCLEGHEPIREQWIDAIKAAVKFALGEGGYYWLRRFILKIVK